MKHLKLFEEVDFENDYDFSLVKNNIIYFLSNYNIYSTNITFPIHIDNNDPMCLNNSGVLTVLKNGNPIFMKLIFRALRRISTKTLLKKGRISTGNNAYALTKLDINDAFDELEKYLKEEELVDFNINRKEYNIEESDNNVKYKITTIFEILPKSWVKRSIKTGLWDMKGVEK